MDWSWDKALGQLDGDSESMKGTVLKDEGTGCEKEWITMGRASQSTAYIRHKPFESTLNYFWKCGITKHLKPILVVRPIMVAAMLWSHDQYSYLQIMNKTL